MKQVWQTRDGQIFNDPIEADNWEGKLARKKQAHFDNYLKTYSGRDLLSKYTLDEYGVWEVRGEDPNCDLGGHHHQPYLFTAEGKLENVIEKAVDTSGFWQWGAGGKIKKVMIEKL